ncbi:RNA binding protein-like protein Ligatin/Tma64 [Tirmania nivea]|nr:RNA binding protein-like protein Ligatin/Tma64 [Tirmania nivea]
MFKKKAQIKPSAPLRSSDRRKIAQSLIDEFNLTPPPSENRDAIVTALRNSLLPDNTTSAKFTTNLGPELDQVQGVVYVGSHAPGEEVQRPLWVKVDGVMFPTVYTLWKNPKLLPLLHTHPPVMEKLYTGADLMTPGLIGPPFPPRATKGRLVGIASSERPSVALAVGVAEVDISGLGKVVGEKGKAVRILHWYGDELAGGAGGAGEVPEKVEGVFDEDVSDGGENGGVSLEGLSLAEEGEGKGEPKGEEGLRETGNQQEQQQLPELTVKEIDDAFHNAFIFGLYHHLHSNTHTTIETPITPSAFMSTLVLPFLPPSSHFDATLGSLSSTHPSLQIKKTSWKNITKFLKHLDKEQFLKTKNRQGNEVVVVDIDWDDERIKDFVPYKLPTPASASSSSSGGAAATATGPLKVLELYKPTPKLFPILEAINANPKQIFSPTDLKSLFSTYLAQETTPHPTNRRLVTLNPLLANILLSPTTSPEDRASLSSNTAKRDHLTQSFVGLCSPCYAVLKPGETYPNGGVKAVAGQPPKITITVEHKRGKVMTRIVGVERFGIDPGALGEELRVLCASSASVAGVPGCSPKNPLMEVMVQGPQEPAVRARLEEKGVPRKCIVCVEGKGGGKKK